MPQNRPCDVTPEGDQDKYSVALQDSSGRWYGLDVLLSQIYTKTNNAPAPLTRIGLNSYHAGRGFDRFTPEQFGFYDARNGWSTTPGKFHATQLFRWARGLRSTDHNMPNSNGVTWKRLIGSQRYLDVSFTASASYTVKRLILLIRRAVPAGAVGVPGTLTVRIRADSAGNPSTDLTSATVTSATLTDVTSEYYVFVVSTSLTASTTYHVTVNGDSTDRDEACWEVACDPSAAGKKSSADSSWTATAFSPYFRMTDDERGRYFKYFNFDNALYALSIYDDLTTSSELYMNGVRGRAVGAQTSTTLKDTGFGTYAAAWTTNRFAGAYVKIIRGDGQGQVRQIASNDTDTLTVTDAWTVTPVAASSEYVVYSTDWWVQIGSTGLGVVSSGPAIQNGIVYFPQWDSINIRIMHLDYTDADDHAFDVENTNNNKAFFLAIGQDTAEGPVLWKANQTTGGVANARAISVSRAPTAPAGVPVPFGTDLTFGTSILCGENTNRITGIHFHDNALYVPKEDSLFVVQNDRAMQVKIGAESGSNSTNGVAIVTASDKQLYMGFDHDVYLITGGGAYPTGLKNNMPSNRSGYVADLEAHGGWIFAAVNAGSASAVTATSPTGYSSVMKYSLDTRSWSEQLRGFFEGRRIRGVQWQDCPETRPRLWIDMQGEMVYQEFPINGVRPFDDTGTKYQHEAEIILPTIDLYSVDPKYFAVLTLTTQGLAQESDTESGHEIVIEYQADNDVGSSRWYYAGVIKTSPTGAVAIDQGNKRMIRLRLRLLSSEATDPVIVETIGLSLFSRARLSHEWKMFFEESGDDDEQNSLELIRWLRTASQTAEPLLMYSRFPLFHELKVTLADEPRLYMQEYDGENEELEGRIGIVLTEVV
jgi:hypothetical protein